MEIVLPILRLSKHEKECEIKRKITPKFSEQTTFGQLFMEVAKKHRVLVNFCMKLPKCVFQTRVNFGRCYGNPGWAEAVEK